MTSRRKVPRIDLSKYDEGATGRRKTVDAFGDALRELGFVRVMGHGIDDDLVRKVYDGWAEFFSLPEEAKRDVAEVAGGARGHTPFGVEHAKDNPIPDLKEFFHVGQELPVGHPLASVYPANVWPAGLPGLRGPTLELYRRLEGVARTLLEGLALYFGLPGDTFVSMMVDGNSILRILHYPPIPETADPAAVRAAEHEDINLITILPEATESGLEILTRDGEWIPVVARSGELVVDSGDMLARVTNDVVSATTHRVVNDPEAATRDRFSMPFFVHPYPSCDLSVHEAFVDENRPPRHPPVTADEYLQQRLLKIGLA